MSAEDRLATLDEFIAYCEATSEDEWQLDVVRDKDNSRNCLFGHLVNWYYGKDYRGLVSDAWDFFESGWASTFFVYQVNDGRNPRYPQPTPRQRCLALLRALADGSEMTPDEAMEHDYRRGATA